ncbi:MAG: hypothetical protein E4G96_05770 [Chrysiogenales bacterium]|nr:MAG: hypothetical protein E4G96_05770 [Chrysiogenales bacterium]
MRLLTIAAVVLLASVLAVSCKMKKDMTLEDYAKMEIEVNLPDPELDKARVEEVAKKYGYTYRQYREFFDRVQADAGLREKLGEIRLKEHSPGD